MQQDTEKHFFIIIGRSGSGKGTQAQLLKKVLTEKGFGKVTHVTTGEAFRAFIKRDNHIARLAREINDKGLLQPEFLAVWNWSNIFIDSVEENETVILDGAPRKPFEVEILHSAITFLGYKNPIVIYLDTAESVSREHLIKRGREDDKGDVITRRINWFDTDVLPAIELYTHDPRYSLIHVNGDQTIKEVHNEIIGKLRPLVSTL